MTDETPRVEAYPDQPTPGKIIFRKLDENGNVTEQLVHKVVEGDPEVTEYRIYGPDDPGWG
jgi:hypothetical protein